DLMFTDLRSGRSEITSLDRFSFLPSFITRILFYPVVVDAGKGPSDDRLPGIMIPASLGSSGATEVIVPRSSPGAPLSGLSRPARLRFATQPGCDALANPVA